MILVHLSVNGKPALVDPTNILFADECEGQDAENTHLSFTRLYLKQPLPGDGETAFVDVKEDIAKLLKAMR